jgi:hypothetical protein
MVFAYMQQDGYCFKVAGENIGLSSYDDDVATATIESGFMGSPSHRENILGNWNHMGVGAYKAADGRKLYAVLFSITCAAAPAPTAKPTVAATPRPTAKPTVAATPRPTAKPTVRATPKPTLVPTPMPTALPTPTPTEAPTATIEPTPTEQPSDSATPSPETSAESSSSPGEAASEPAFPDTGAVIGDSPSGLRVRDKASNGGLLDSLFGAFFGGLLRF